MPDFCGQSSPDTFMVGYCIVVYNLLHDFLGLKVLWTCEYPFRGGLVILFFLFILTLYIIFFYIYIVGVGHVLVWWFIKHYSIIHYAISNKKHKYMFVNHLRFVYSCLSVITSNVFLSLSIFFNLFILCSVLWLVHSNPWW